jgi:hypothetical protein
VCNRISDKVLHRRLSVSWHLDPDRAQDAMAAEQPQIPEPRPVPVYTPKNVRLPIDGHSFRRVEVLTGSPRRRRWGAAEKAAIATVEISD